tara:strand:- start:693 stop:1271 length:579 start_codon:yes stop_codon:yes gene_type:complete
MKEYESIDQNISKLAFLFLTYSVITGGYVTKVLSCQLQHAMEMNIYMKHVIGFILIFVFIMLEGGWDFSKQENDKHANDWSNGNSLHSLVFAAILYIIFVLSSKMQLIPNLVFLGSLFMIYVINTQRLYWTNRQSISSSTEHMIKIIERSFIGGCVIVFIYGLSDYYMYQKRQYGSSFRMKTFILGKKECHS